MSTPSGLQYEVLVEGEGERPFPTSRVKVKYKGTLLDGTVFDESGDQEIEFGVNQVIPGWTEALQLMNPGAKFKLYIPPDIAYGPQGSGEKIGPNSLLIFEVELISFESRRVDLNRAGLSPTSDYEHRAWSAMAFRLPRST